MASYRNQGSIAHLTDAVTEAQQFWKTFIQHPDAYEDPPEYAMEDLFEVFKVMQTAHAKEETRAAVEAWASTPDIEEFIKKICGDSLSSMQELLLDLVKEIKAEREQPSPQ